MTFSLRRSVPFLFAGSIFGGTIHLVTSKNQQEEHHNNKKKYMYENKANVQNNKSYIPTVFAAELPPKIIPGQRREDLPDIDIETIVAHNGKKNENKKGGGNSSSDNHRIYVTYKAGVYDVTDFVEQHPGGKKRIMLAAGASIAPFWASITIHNDEAVHRILESMRIGNVKGFKEEENDGITASSSSSSAANDPIARLWGAEPRRSSALETMSARPFNAQPPDAALETFYTPNDLYFVRNHMPVPLFSKEEVEGEEDGKGENKNGEGRGGGVETEASSEILTSPPQPNKKKPFCLLVEGKGIATHCFTIAELRSLFREHTVSATMECGGNRRSEMSAVADSLGRPAVKGLPWTNGAISTASWSGFLLTDVIDYCRFLKVKEGHNNNSNNGSEEEKEEKPAAVSLADSNNTDNDSNDSNNNDNDINAAPPSHVQFQGADGDAAGHFAVSVPYGLATDPHRSALIATTMNGSPIPRDHGYPLRAVIPGTVGVRNCKWLTKVTLQGEEAQTLWQQHDYKNFPAYADKPDSSLPSVYAMPVTSAITDATLVSVEGDDDYNNNTVNNNETEVNEKEAGAEATEAGGGSGEGPQKRLVFVKGYAYTGNGAGVQRVELSADGGKTFQKSAFLYKRNHPTADPESFTDVDDCNPNNFWGEENNNNDKLSTPTILLAPTGGLTGPTNITADEQHNGGPAASSSSPSSSASNSKTTSPVPQKDWTWTFFSGGLDVTKVPPSRYVEAPPTPPEAKGGSGGAMGGNDTTKNADDANSSSSSSSVNSPSDLLVDDHRAPCWTVCSRAVTNDNSAQPPFGSYNFRGLLYNGYSCREVCSSL